MLVLKEKVNKPVSPASVSPAKLAHSRCSENVDWGGGGGGIKMNQMWSLPSRKWS